MRNEVSIFVFIAGLATFNWPFLKIFEFSLPVYLFVVWMLLITVNMIYSYRKEKDRRGR